MLDAHCHLDRYPDPPSVAAAASREGVFVIAVTNLPSHFEIGLPHVAQLSRVRLALGLHPLAADQHAVELPRFERLLRATSFVGEVGLDFSSEGKATAAIQVESFRKVAKLVAATLKFVTLHSRGAERETLSILQEFGVRSAVFHWWSGPLTLIDDVLSAGHFFSVNPAMTESEKGRAVIARIPRERLLTETDGPYVKSRGKPVTPSGVQIVERFLAESWTTTVDDVRRSVWNNFRNILSELGLLKGI